MNSVFVISILIMLYGPIITAHPDARLMVADTSIRSVQQIPGKYLSEISNISDNIRNRVNNRADKSLGMLLKQERKMKARLFRIDSTAAKDIFTKSIDSLERLKTGLKNKVTSRLSIENSYLDSMGGALKFLESRNISGVSEQQLAYVTGSIESLHGKLQQADQIRDYIRQHKIALKEQLSKYTVFSKDLRKISKEAYYYGQQVKEYKSILADRKKAEAKAIALLHKIPAYHDFLRKNTQLASLFNLGTSSDNNTAQNPEGLQTRAQVEQLIQQRLGNDPAARQALTQQLDQARAQLNELKEQFPDLDNAGDMPDFKPNPMKTKSFLQRLEFGGNVQFQKSSRYFPATSDIAGQVGYKFHKNGTVGIGMCYKLGLGAGWNAIVISHQGVGLRSYVDWKLKGTFFVNGGYEQNYVSAITHVQQLKDRNSWQGSALLGISKKYKVSARLKGNIILLYDFLAKSNIPSISPVKLRLGYSF